MDKEIKAYLKTKIESFKERKANEKIVFRIIDLLEFITSIPTNFGEITIIENDFDWKKYFALPNEIEVPIYNETEWAVAKVEIVDIKEKGLIVYNLSYERKFIDFNKFRSFDKEYGELMVLFDFKENKLFEEV